MLTFGDNLGLPESDMFQIMDGSTLYCYGLSLRSDVDLDLGGNTIYYLPEGMSHNGIQGMGFEDLGANWYNGSILPIPEPMTMILLLIGLVGLRRKA